MAKAWTSATAAILVSLIAYFAAVAVASTAVVAYLIWLVPVIGACVGAFVAPRSKFNIGAATFIPAAVLIGAAGYFLGRMGFGDFVGLQGHAIGVLLSLPFVAVASVIGALIGEWASKGRADA